MKRLCFSFIVLVFITSFVFSAFFHPVQAVEIIPISTPEELNNIRNNLSGHYQLTVDIDMSSFGNWVPIGTYAVGFSGILDGDGHTIRNLTISHPNSHYIGLFGEISSSGSVTNLQISSATIEGYNYVGILTGMNYGTITNIAVHGEINGMAMVGGLSGYNNGSVDQTYSISSITGNSNFGGLIGYNDNIGEINNSYSASYITKLSSLSYDAFHGGGLIGNKLGSVVDSYYDSDITNVTINNLGTAYSTANMKIMSSFNGWNFPNPWYIIESETYPSLFPFFVTIEKDPSQPEPASTSPINFVATFSEPIDKSSFTSDDVEIGGTAGADQVVITEITPNNGTTFKLAVSGMTSDGTVSVAVPEGKVIDTLNNFNLTGISNILSYEPDTTPPTVTISSTTTSPTNSSSIPISITFSEDVTEFSIEDVQVTNGTLENFSGSGNVYTAEIIPTKDGTVRADIPVNAAVDIAGNGNEAASQFQIEYDTTPPEVTTFIFIRSHTNLSVIDPIVEFSEDVIGFDPSKVLVENGSFNGFSYFSPSTLILLISPNAEGLIEVTISEGVVTDRAGNSYVSSNQHSIVYDITPPTMTINQSASQNDPTKNQPIHFTAIFSEPIVSDMFIYTSDLSVNGVTGTPTINITEIAPNVGTTFDIAVSGLTQSDTVSVSLSENQVIDLAGNYNLQSTSTDNSVEYDITNPTVTISTSASDLTNQSPIPISIEFSESVVGFELSDIAVTNGTASNFSGADDTYTAEIIPLDDGLVTAEIHSGMANDTAGNINTASSQLTIEYDGTPPSVTVEQSIDQTDPTNISPVHFTATFSEPIDPKSLSSEDVLVEGNAGASGVTITPLTPASFDIAIATIPKNGTIQVSIPNETVKDTAGNFNTTSTSKDNIVTYDAEELMVSIEKSENQPDQTNTTPIRFTVVFNKPIFMESFTVDDFELQAPAGATITSLSETEPFDDTTFEVSVDGITEDGLVTLTLSEGKVQDLAGNTNSASSSSDNSVLFDTQSPLVEKIDIEKFYEGNPPEQFNISFSEAMYNPEGDSDPHDVTNPANYLLVEWGENATFDTTSCKDGWQENDQLIKISSVTYDEDTFETTLKLPYKLQEGSYRLFICGSATLYDAALNPFNNSLDSIHSFFVLPEPEEEEENINSSQSPTLLPETGFPIGQTTLLTKQQAIHNYTGTELNLEIPIAGVKTSIVGVPLVDGDWEVSWLGNQAGYLYGSAYPTWQGNTVITGHVWNANNTPGIFFHLKTLKYGDLIHIHAYGMIYTYEVRENRLISESNLKAAFQSEKSDWVTLLTCEGYQPSDKSYVARRMVRAVLVSVE